MLHTCEAKEKPHMPKHPLSVLSCWSCPPAPHEQLSTDPLLLPFPWRGKENRLVETSAHVQDQKHGRGAPQGPAGIVLLK